MSTDAHNAEERQRESEARFRLMADHTPVMIWMCDPDKKCTYFNRAWFDFTGRTAEQELGSGWLDNVHPDDLGPFMETANKGFGARVSFRVEFRLRRSDGAYRWVLGSAVPLLSADGQLEGYIGSTLDLHDRKAIEHELEVRVRERTRELQELNQALIAEIGQRKRAEDELSQSRKLEAVGRLAGGVAHDFNNLMTGILCVSDEILVEKGLRERVRDDVQEIAKAAARAAALTKQLLAFGRRQVAAPQRVDLNHVIGDMQTMLRRLIGEDIDLSFSPGPDLGAVQIDPGQVEQVLMNLVMNARDAMPNGGKITIKSEQIVYAEGTRERHVEITPGRYAHLSIADTGTGMTAETQAHAFEPFFTTKGLDKGTGLGLATVYGIVKQNGGHIYFESGDGTGTTFDIYLPSVEAPVDRPNGAARPEPQPSNGTETVLVVEDEPIVRRVASRALASRGYRVLVASEAHEALQIAEAYDGRIDLLLTDVVMPGMNGRQLAERLSTVRPEMKVLFMSGYSEDVIVKRGVLAPGINFIEKTFTSTTLSERVRDVLDGRSKR